MSERFVISFGFAVIGLMFFSEMGAARLAPSQGVVTENLSELEEVRDTSGFFE
jgi:hypothetical protein